MRVDGHWAAWPPAIAWMGILIFLSVQSGIDAPAGIQFGDKIAHAVAYGVLGALLSLARLPGGKTTWGRVALVTTLVAGYGAGTEFLQGLVPHRQADGADVVADAVGGFVAAAMTLLWHRRTARRVGLR